MVMATPEVRNSAGPDGPPEPACRQFALDYRPIRPRFGRSSMLSIAFAIALGTGIYLEFLADANWNAGKVVLTAHIVLGLGFTVVFASWIGAHVRKGLRSASRRAFRRLSWFLLTLYVLLLATGLLMVLPSALYLGGVLWFWRFETTGLLTFVHLWGSLAAMATLFAHLAMRHWRHPIARRGRQPS
jgi:hypothetical protein